LRIAIYSHYFLPEIGAPSARIGDFATQWQADGHRVQIATCFPSHPTGVIYPGYKRQLYRKEELGGLEVHRSWTYIAPNKGFLRKSIGHATFWISAGCLSTRRMPAPDCVIGSSPTFFAAMAARACARRHRVPFIMEVRDLWPAIFVDLGVIRNHRIIRLLERWEMNLYHSAARIVTVTESFRENLIRRGIAPEKIVTITNGADVDYWRPESVGTDALRQELGLQNAFIALYIGAHGISQGLSAVIRTAERLRNEPRVRFVFVGEGADKEQLVREAGRLKLTNVRFVDSVGKSKVRNYYAMADVCLVPLRDIPLFDTFIPSKMFEIMAMGRPIIASVRGEAAEILRRSGAAAVVDPEDDQAIAAAITQMCGSGLMTSEMGIRGRRFVTANYSRRELARRYLEVIDEARAIAGSGQGK